VPDIQSCGVVGVAFLIVSEPGNTKYTDSNKKGGDMGSIVGALDADNAEIVLVQFLLHQEMVELLHVQLLAPGMTVLLPALAALVLSAAPYLVSNVAKSGFVELGQHVPNPVEQHKLGNFHIYKGPNHSQTIGFACAVLRNNGTRILHRPLSAGSCFTPKKTG
jgi:hypothetical protein